MQTGTEIGVITHLEPNLACDGAVVSANMLHFCMAPGKL